MKGLIYPTLKTKTEHYFSPIHQFLLIGFLDEKPKCKSLVHYIYSAFTVAIVTENDRQNRLHIEKMPFEPNLRLWETSCLRISNKHS